MFKLVVAVILSIVAYASAKPGLIGAPLAYTSPIVAAPAPYVTASSAQVVSRSVNGLASPYVAAAPFASPYVAAAAPIAAAYSAYPYAAPYSAYPYAAAAYSAYPYAGRLAASPYAYAASPYAAAAYSAAPVLL